MSPILAAHALNDTNPDKPLSAKQRRFVDEYLVDMNASAAARRAGYRDRSADQHGYFLTHRPNVAAVVEARLRERRERMAVTTERVIRELARIAFADVGRIMTWSGKDMTMNPSEQLSEDDRAAIAELTVVTRKNGDVAARVVLHDKERALEALCRFLGLFGPRAAYQTGVLESPSVAAARIRAMILERHAKLRGPEAEPSSAEDAEVSQSSQGVSSITRVRRPGGVSRGDRPCRGLEAPSRHA